MDEINPTVESVRLVRFDVVAFITGVYALILEHNHHRGTSLETTPAVIAKAERNALTLIPRFPFGHLPALLQSRVSAITRFRRAARDRRSALLSYASFWHAKSRRSTRGFLGHLVSEKAIEIVHTLSHGLLSL
jgi:hypothetical protein